MTYPEPKRDGSVKHDGDCTFWSWKVCTCGLLHRLIVKSRPQDEYPEFWKDKTAHDHVLDRLLRPDAPRFPPAESESRIVAFDSECPHPWRQEKCGGRHEWYGKPRGPSVCRACGARTAEPTLGEPAPPLACPSCGNTEPPMCYECGSPRKFEASEPEEESHE